MRISCSDIELNRDNARFQIKVDENPHESFVISGLDFSNSDRDILRVIPLLMAVNLGACASFKHSTVRIVSCFPIPDKWLQLAYKCLVYTQKSLALELDGMFYSNGVEISAPRNDRWTYVPTRTSGLYDSACTMSGGKDSMLSYCLLKTLAGSKEVLPFTVKWATIASGRGMSVYINEYLPKVGITPMTAYTDCNRQGRLYQQIGFDVSEDDTRNHRKGAFSYYFHTYHMVQIQLMKVAARQNGIGCVFTGSPLMTVIENGVIEQGDLYESVFGFELLNTMIPEILVSSVLMPLSNIAEVKMIDDRYYDTCKVFSSCLTQINRYCYSCDKCLNTWLIMKALGIDLKRYDFDEEKLFDKHRIFKMSKDEMIASDSFWMMGDEEFGFIAQAFLEKVNSGQIELNEKTAAFVDGYIFASAKSVGGNGAMVFDETVVKYITDKYQKVADLFKSYGLTPIKRKDIYFEALDAAFG